MARVRWQALCFLVVAGCGRSMIFFGTAPASGSTSGCCDGGGTSCGSETLEQFFSQALGAECAAEESACPIVETTAAYLVSACPAQALGLFANEIAELSASVDAGRMRFDPCAAAACVQSMPEVFPDAGVCGSVADAALVSPFALPDVRYLCPEVFVGTSPDGGPCSSALDCADGFCSNGQNYRGNYDQLNWLAGGACLGSCLPFFQLGQGCAVQAGLPTLVPTPSCAPGLLCGGAGPVCEALAGLGGQCGPYVNGCAQGYCALAANSIPPYGVCTAYAVQGEACSLASYCASTCCGPGLQCTGTGDSGICTPAPPLGAGAPCDSLQACAVPLICAGYEYPSGDGGRAGVCALPRDVGGSCVPAMYGSSGCLSGLDCVAGSCQLPPTEGACAPTTSQWPFSAPCDLSSYCDSATSTCQPLQPLGTSCTAGAPDDPCQAGSCDDESGVCSLTECAE